MTTLSLSPVIQSNPSVPLPCPDIITVMPMPSRLDFWILNFFQPHDSRRARAPWTVLTAPRWKISRNKRDDRGKTCRCITYESNRHMRPAGWLETASSAFHRMSAAFFRQVSQYSSASTWQRRRLVLTLEYSTAERSKVRGVSGVVGSLAVTCRRHERIMLRNITHQPAVSPHNA